MNRTPEEWIEFYNKKAPEPFERDERFALFYLPDKGFCEIGVTDNLVVIWQACGDGRFWKKFAESIAREFNRKVCATLNIRREAKAYMRSFGFKAQSTEEKAGFTRYTCTDKNGRWGLMTECVDEDGRRKFWVTWEVKSDDEL